MPLNLICHLEESPLVSVFSEVGTLRDNIYYNVKMYEHDKAHIAACLLREIPEIILSVILSRSPSNALFLHRGLTDSYCNFAIINVGEYSEQLMLYNVIAYLVIL